MEGTFLEAFRIVGILFGLVLHGVLMVVIMSRRERKPAERVFFTLALALFCWFLGLAASLLYTSNPLSGTVIEDVQHALHPADTRPPLYYFNLLSAVALAFVPPLLLHTVIAFYTHHFSQPMRLSRKALVLGLVYAPIGFYLYYLWDSFFVRRGPFDSAFVLELAWWLAVQTVLYFFVFSTILYRMASQVERRDEQKFYNALAATLVTIGITVFTVYVLLPAYRREAPGVIQYLDVFCILSPAVPTAVFSYYVFRYYAMEMFIRRSVVYFFASLMTVIVYAFVIRGILDELVDTHRLNPTLIEGLLLVALFGLLQALIKGLGWLADNYSGRSTLPLKQALGVLTQKMSRATGANADLLVGFIEQRLQDLFRTRPVRIIVDAGILGKSATHAQRWTALRPQDEPVLRLVPFLLDEFQKNNRQPFDLFEPPTAGQLEVLRELDSEYIIPLGSAERVFGILSCGRRPIIQPLLPDERQLFVTFSIQLSTVLHAVGLMEEQIGMQARMLENEKLATLGMLSATVAHEVRNPLSSIKAIVQVMAQGTADENQKQDLDIIQGEIDRLTRVVSQLLSFAKGGETPGGAQAVSHLVSDVLLLLDKEAAMGGITIHRDIAEAVAARMLPAGALREVLFNLVLNAVQAAGKGGEVTVEARSETDGLMLRIRDTGPGISEEARKNAFEPFFTTKQTGTGLGLPIVKQRVKSLGGSVEISPPGEQSAVSVYLPDSACVTEEQGMPVA